VTRSVLYQRIHTLEVGVRMPPLSSTRIDDAGSDVIRRWIDSLGADDGTSGWQLR